MARYVIFFRGDSRPPAEIFKIGFSPKKIHIADPFTPVGGLNAPQTCVSMSESLPAAAFFPCQPEEGKKQDTWIYLVAVDVEKDNRFHEKFSKLVMSATDSIGLKVAHTAREHVVGHVANQMILAAIPVNRSKVFTTIPVFFDSFAIDTQHIIYNPASFTTLKKCPELKKILQRNIKEIKDNFKYTERCPYPLTCKEALDAYKESFFIKHRAQYEGNGDTASSDKNNNNEFFSKFSSIPLDYKEQKKEQQKQKSVQRSKWRFFKDIQQGQYDEEIAKEKSELNVAIDQDFRLLMGAFTSEEIEQMKKFDAGLKTIIDDFPMSKVKLGL